MEDIMPFHKERYPDNWKQISLAIRERARQQCEWCGVKNGAIGARDKHGVWHDEDNIHHMNSDTGYLLFGDFPDMRRIVLTVAHIDHDTMNNDPSNLAALCQKCHLGHDREQHTRNAARTRLRRKLQAGNSFIDETGEVLAL